MKIRKSRCLLWKDEYLIKIIKKGDLSSCSNNRRITLLFITSKVFNRVLLKRIKMLWTLCYETRKLALGPTDLHWPDCNATYYLRAVSGVEFTFFMLTLLTTKNPSIVWIGKTSGDCYGITEDCGHNQEHLRRNDLPIFLRPTGDGCFPDQDWCETRMFAFSNISKCINAKSFLISLCVNFHITSFGYSKALKLFLLFSLYFIIAKHTASL